MLICTANNSNGEATLYRAGRSDEVICLLRTESHLQVVRLYQPRPLNDQKELQIRMTPGFAWRAEPPAVAPQLKKRKARCELGKESTLILAFFNEP